MSAQRIQFANLCLLASVFLTLIAFGVEGRTMFRREENGKPSWAAGQDCAIYKNEALHVVMDRVCLFCHEMFSHQNSNMRVDCRAQCFSNDQFRACLNLFKQE
uniref:Uncharacterized protein n=1 Tax=Steinernema glaseri TaxID=37863 RepID=A0A1I8AJS6_9BILA